MKEVIFCIITAGLLCFTACGRKVDSSQNGPQSKSFFAMDTYMTITVYGENAETALNQAEERVTELEKLWSVTDENSEIYAINHSRGGNVHVSPETAELLDFSLDIFEVTIGTKPDGTDWKLGLRSPFDEGSFATLEVSDCAVITSGGYERYFVGDDDETYWHILDPETGKPAHSGLVSVTIVGKEGRLCNALSTSLFVMGLDKATELWKQYDDFEMVLVSEEGEIYLTEGLEENFSLNQMYGNLQTEVIHR